MSTSESVLNEMEVAATNLSDSIKKYRALLVEEKFTPTNTQSAAIAQIADRIIALRNKVHIQGFDEVCAELLEIGQQLRAL